VIRARALLAAIGLALAATGPLPAAAAPARSLQAEIDAAPAGAEIVVQGTHFGGVVIRKPLRLTGGAGAMIDAQGKGTIIRIDSPNVIVRGFTLRASGAELHDEDSGVFVGAANAVLEDLVLDDVLFGLNLKNAHGTIVRRVSMRGKDLPISRRGDSVRLWYSDRVTLSTLRVRRLRDLLLWFSKHSVVHDVDVRDSRYGIHFMQAEDLRVIDSHFQDNTVGAYVMYSTRVLMEGNRILRHRHVTGIGLALKESDDVIVRRNLIAGNHWGVYVDGTPHMDDAKGEIVGNVIAGNDTAFVILSNVSRNVIAENVVDGNGEQIRIEGGGREGNVWTHGRRGNYWSDYAGLDVGGDGVGDTPYKARQWFEGLEQRFPASRILWGSLAVTAVDFAARLIPLFPPQVLMEDARPLTAAAIPERFRGPGLSWPFAGAAFACGLAGAALFWAAARPRRRSSHRKEIDS